MELCDFEIKQRNNRAREWVHIGLWMRSAKWEAREYLSGKRREILHVRRLTIKSQALK